jgi:hypothetical protein
MADDIAGSPVSLVRWSRRSTYKLSDELKEKGILVCPSSVGIILKDNDFTLKANRKCISETHHPHRNWQFEIIAETRKRFEDAGQPIISVDSKKKELIGNLKTGAKPGERIMTRFMIMIFVPMQTESQHLTGSLSLFSTLVPFLWECLMILPNLRWTASSNG